ncbi:hypothetical protein [Nitrosomonas sp.]|uniref:hypothetical protein n=1 Tax=Nitrosomonas sp. TaxID=42353 RepID=UPI0028529CA2|nr:hypothetical protein [Nitrosomonas sp.]
MARWYVFQRANGTGYISEQRKQLAKIIKESGVSFTIHDLRQTFVTVAESLDISAYAVKCLVNHKMSNDITPGYFVTDVERLRQPMHHVQHVAYSHYLARILEIYSK